MTTIFQHTETGFVASQFAATTLDYGLDWSDFFAAVPSDSIAQSEWTPATPGVAVSNGAVSGNVASVWLDTTAAAPGWYRLTNKIVTEQGRSDVRVCLLRVLSAVPAQSAVFGDLSLAVARFRTDYLPTLQIDWGEMPLSDAFIEDRLRAAEAHVAHALRVRLRPTTFFPVPPSTAQLAELAGAPWDVDPGYELDSHDMQYGGIRMLKLRQLPVIEVLRVQMVYPGLETPLFTLPPNWLRLDAKYGQLQIVPLGSQVGYATPAVGMVAGAMSGGAVVPQVFHVTYRAGLQNVADAFPDLVDIAMRLGLLGTMKARMLPQSGSISADGLSESVSAPSMDDVEKGIDGELAAIRDAITGVRFGVL